MKRLTFMDGFKEPCYRIDGTVYKNEVAQRLAANVDAVHAVLTQKKVKCDWEQAERVAWRIVKDWVEAQMAILESEMVQLDEIFLPYMVNNNGQTLFQAYRNNQLMLEGGDRE